MGKIGIPDEYTAIICDSETLEPIYYLPWSNISWQRVRNDISSASVTVSEMDGGIECCASFGGLRVWDHMLRIERDGVVVWDGPIIGWGRSTVNPGSSRDVTIRAMDRGFIIQRRFLATTLDCASSPQDYGNAIASIFASSLTALPYPLSTEVALADVFTQDIYRADRLEPIATILSTMVEVLDQFWTVLTDTLHVFDELSFWQPHRALPVLNERTVIDIPGVEVDGSELTTIMYAAAAGTGASGFPVIAFVDFRPLVADTTDAELHGLASTTNSPLAYDGAGAATVAQAAGASKAAPNLTIEQMRLSPEFGAPFINGLDGLVPGIRCALDFEDTCMFNVPVVVYDIVLDEVLSSTSCQHVRVDQIDVTVGMSESGVDEQVMISCIPWIVDPRAWDAV